MTSNVYACKTHHNKSVIQKFTFRSAGARPKRNKQTNKQEVWLTQDDKTISCWTKENGVFKGADDSL